jgi:hypothetical protein
MVDRAEAAATKLVPDRTTPEQQPGGAERF